MFFKPTSKKAINANNIITIIETHITISAMPTLIFD